MELGGNGGTKNDSKLVDSEKMPKLGMIFDLIEDVEVFYNAYAKVVGFSIRKGAEYKHRVTKETYSKLFVCSKEGKPCGEKKVVEDGKRRIGGLIRENCEAAIRVTKDKDGGYQNVGCTSRDIRNFERDIRQEKKDYDAELLLEHFKESAEINPSFFYRYEVDEEDKLTHCFWVDGWARKAYAYFGDVVVFDPTYNTNQYYLIFAPFTGVNHHEQTLNFGVGLIKDEKTESFLWLFDKWLEAMSGCAPKVILTDQDLAIEKAISISFPQTYHKFCMWHILNKLPEKLGSLGDRLVMDRLLNCIYNSLSVDDFVNEWSNILSQHDLQNNGIPCRHILIVLRNERMYLLPENLILKRWTKNVTSEIVMDKCGIELHPNFDEVIDGKKINLKNKVSKVLEVALRVDEAFVFVSQMIDVILEELSKYTFDSIAKAKMLKR
ncbi:hypothetical protein H6P81_003649 [Aristolochia fimbriata]|uniref:Protein FAR1-RELATED SEQUENCE n=1 Tax=Aristolochia fimbriata TaxID=158543 RepID=A0AAV7FEA2_ARIFI|nr:hypothetical protein H6P81_003649 [Aristolochia fimbriata]